MLSAETEAAVELVREQMPDAPSASGAGTSTPTRSWQ